MLESGAGLPPPLLRDGWRRRADLRAALPEGAPLALAPGERALIPTGVALALPEGWEAQVRPRSGLALRHGLTTLNAPGTSTPMYRGEIGVILVNLGAEPVRIERGMRIAQLVIAPVTRARWRVVDALPRKHARRRRFRLHRGGRGMLRISRKTLLAIEAVVDVALHARPDPVHVEGDHPPPGRGRSAIWSR